MVEKIGKFCLEEFCDDAQAKNFNKINQLFQERGLILLTSVEAPACRRSAPTNPGAVKGREFVSFSHAILFVSEDLHADQAILKVAKTAF